MGNDEEKHVYYWAWSEQDNKGEYSRPKLFRVFRYSPNTVHDAPITEAMSRGEAIKYCERIVKLTGGKEI